MAIAVTFKPSAISREIRTDPGSLSCTIEGLSATLPLALVGSCVSRPPPSGAPTTVTASVRGRTTFNVALPKNDTDSPITLAPSLTHEFFTGPVTVVVPANGSATYPVTYSPLLSTVPLNLPGGGGPTPPPLPPSPTPDILFSYAGVPTHECALFLPYPDGNGVLLPIAGTTTAATPLPALLVKAPAKATTPIAVAIYNPLRVPQRFSISWPIDAVPATATLAGPRTIDVPPLSSREARLVYGPTLEGFSRIPISIISETFPTESFVVDVEVMATAPGVAGALSLTATVRGSASHTIAIPIPPAFARPNVTPPAWILSCNHPALVVTRLPSGPDEALFKLVFRPTVPTESAAAATAAAAAAAVAAAPAPAPATASKPPTGGKRAGSASPVAAAVVDIAGAGILALPSSGAACVTLAAADSLGVFVYEVALQALAAGPEAPIRFSASLGTRTVAAFRFKHSAPGSATFKATLVDDGGGAFTVPATVSVSAPLPGSDGAEGVVEVTYVGPSVGMHSGELRLDGENGAGTFTVPLRGETGAPANAGPFILSPGAAGTSLDWTSPFTDDRDLALTSDMPATFITTPAPGSIKAGKRAALKLDVRYVPTTGVTTPESARIVLVAKSRAAGESDAVWVFYVRGIPPVGGAAPAAEKAPPAKKK